MSTLVLTRCQEAAVRAFTAFLNDPAWQVFTLCGFAGTGKSTLLAELVGLVPGGPDVVRVAAPTGKAAMVLRGKGFPFATTIHRLFYRAVKCASTEHPPNCECLPQVKFVLRPREEITRGVRLIVVDEASMVDSRMTGELVSLGVKLLAVGDPFQLPPISSPPSILDLYPQSALLDEVCRQALDSPVLRLATHIREHRSLPLGSEAGTVVTDNMRNVPSDLDWANTPYITGRNLTRHTVNSDIRQQFLGRGTWLPEPGDRVVCRRNDNQVGILNGELFTVEKAHSLGMEWFSITIRNEAGEAFGIRAWELPFQGMAGALQYKSEYRGRRALGAQEMHHGYSLTAHSAQGSEWHTVFVYDESWCFRDKKWNWLYTAVTRAAHRVVVLANYGRS